MSIHLNNAKFDKITEEKQYEIFNETIKSTKKSVSQISIINKDEIS